VDEVSSQVNYFCGFGPACSPVAGSAARLARAKRNVERHYAVVGVLEDMQSTATALEAYLPRFFKGLSKVIKRRVNVNRSKPTG